MEEQSQISSELQSIDREHQRNVRILNARPILRKLWFGSGVLLAVGIVIFFIVTIIGYIISGSFSDIRTAGMVFGANVQNFHAISTAEDAQPLSLGSVKILQGTPSSIDFFTTVNNPNDDWYATFTYTFSSGSLVSHEEKGFVLPGEKAYILALGVKSEQKPSSGTVALDNIVWHRVDRHIAPDIVAWTEDHANFVIEDATYVADVAFADSTIGRTTFTVTNATPFAYWTVPFQVILERAGAIVGVSQAIVSEFESGEAQIVDVRWYDALPATATVTVLPSVNYFDTSVYMPPRGAANEDIRDSITR